MTTRRQQKGLPNNSPSSPPLPVDDFRHTDDYRRYLAKYIDPVSLMSLRVVIKAWQIVVDPHIDGLVKGGSLLVHGGNDISYNKAIALRLVIALSTTAPILKPWTSPTPS